VPLIQRVPRRSPAVTVWGVGFESHTLRSSVPVVTERGPRSALAEVIFFSKALAQRKSQLCEPR